MGDVMSDKFTLSRHQVPEPPYGSKAWFDWLRWMVVVMNPDDPQFHFVASLLSSAVRYGRLTEKQAAAGNRAIERITAAYEAGDLLCLKTGSAPAEVVPLAPRLAIDNTGNGNA